MRCSRASPLCQYASWGVAMTSRTHRPTSATSRRVDPQRLIELRQALGGLSNDASDSKTVNVGELQAALLATLPRIIAVNWEPESGKHQLDAAVANVLARLKSQSTASALKRAVDASKAVSRAGTSVQGKKYQPSNQVAPLLPRVFDCPRRPRHRRVPDRWDEIRGAGGNVLRGFCRQVRRNNPELDAHPTAPVKRAGVAADPLARPPFFARAHAHADV